MARYSQQPQQGVGIAYTPHYDPGFFETAGNILQQAQQRTDTASAALGENLGQYGQEFSFNPELKDEIMGTYREDLKSILNDYGGDPGAARNRLIRRMSEEAANPFWQANRYQVEQANIAQEAQLKLGPNAMFLNDPRNPEALRKAIADGDMRALETNVMQRNNYGAVIDELGKRITPEQKQILLRKYRNNPEVQGFLESGMRTHLNEEMRIALARDLVPLFKDLAPSVYHEGEVQGGLDPNYAWTQDDDAIAQKMAQAWAYKDIDQTEMKWQQDPIGIAQLKTSLENPPINGSGNVYLGDVAFQELNRNKIDSKYNMSPVTTVDDSPFSQSGASANIVLKRNPRKTEQQMRDKFPAIKTLEDSGMGFEHALEFLKLQELKYNATLDTSVELHNAEASTQLVQDILGSENLNGTFIWNGKNEKMENLRGKLQGGNLLGTRVVPGKGEIEIRFNDSDGKVGIARISSGVFDRSTNKTLKEFEEFHTQLYNLDSSISTQPGDETRTVEFQGIKYDVTNYLIDYVDPQTGQNIKEVVIMMAPEGTKNWAPADLYTANLNQELRNSILVNKSLNVNIPKQKLDIWNN